MEVGEATYVDALMKEIRREGALQSQGVKKAFSPESFVREIENRMSMVEDEFEMLEIEVKHLKRQRKSTMYLFPLFSSVIYICLVGLINLFGW